MIGKILNQISLKVINKRYDYRHSFLVSKAYGRYFTKKLKETKPDVIVAPAASGELAFTKTRIPVIYITDGTFAGCLNYHKGLSNLLKRSIVEGNSVEQLAVDAARYVVVSSEWARASVIKDYKAKEEKVISLPYGANFENLPEASELDYRIPNEWKLLFVGVYWENKGGQFAFNAFRILADKGYKVSLTVLGCLPPESVQHSSLTVIPFVDKNDSEGQKKLVGIYKEHHFLLLPTRFDCTPIVINEASAFAIPSLVANSGGVEGHLKDGVNGYLIDYNDTGEAYAEMIESLMRSPDRYLDLRKTTRKLFEERLNWNYWTAEFGKLLNACTS